MMHASGSRALWLGGSTCPSGAFPLPSPSPLASVMLFFQFLVFRVFVGVFFRSLRLRPSNDKSLSELGFFIFIYF